MRDPSEHAGVTPPSPRPWATHERYELLGTGFEVMCTSPELSARVHELLLPFCAGCQQRQLTCKRELFVVDDDSGYQLYDARRLLCSSPHCVPVLSFLVSVLNAEAIDGFAGFAAHAGVVADANAGIALLATSGVGKSTLVAASLSAGLQYVSDEALCVSYDSRQVVTYPKPLQLSSFSRNILGLGIVSDIEIKGPASYGELGGSVASPSIELTHLVQLARRPGPTNLTRVPPNNGVVWLLELAFNHFKRPTKTFELVTELAAQCEAWQLEYEDARQGVRLIEQRLRCTS